MSYPAENESAISSEEKQLIIQLRQNVHDELPACELSKSAEDQDLFLVRWIRARDHNLNKATEMLRKALKWRSDQKADEGLNFKIHPFFSKQLPFWNTGTDKHGHPLMMTQMANWDCRKFVNNNELCEAFDNFVVNFFEKIMESIRIEHSRRSKDQQEPITLFTIIADASNFPYGQLLHYSAIRKLIDMTVVYEAYYPEILHKAYFYNCPSYFGVFLKLLKPFMAEKTVSKIVLYSSPEEWKRDVGDIVKDLSEVPEQFGGTLKCTVIGKDDDDQVKK